MEVLVASIRPNGWTSDVHALVDDLVAVINKHHVEDGYIAGALSVVLANIVLNLFVQTENVTVKEVTDTYNQLVMADFNNVLDCKLSKGE